MRVKVVKAFGAYSVGAVIPDMPGNQARTLIERGLVRAAALQAPADRMIRAAPIQKGQKPPQRGGT